MQDLLERENSLPAQIERIFAGRVTIRLEKDKKSQNILWLSGISDISQVLGELKENPELLFDRLSDVTAYDNIDKIDGDKRFVLVYELYSMSFFTRLRVKCLVSENEEPPSSTQFWKAANWLEREVFDMFGIKFAQHPDLRRIMMDERFEGFPLRKEYSLKDRQPFPDSQPVRIISQGSGR